MADKLKMMDGNEAASDIAYRATSMAIIYPITPSSPMAENYEAWSNAGARNIWGEVPEVSAMQSEAGAIAAVHGALQSGVLTTTFTASQGLLLMIPNLYKIAGELHPFVAHVSARTLARHALSIFGDHSDVMACRQIGLAMLASNSAQEAHDMALVAHAATLESRVPFMHFFDGFRTSHEVNMVARISDEIVREMIPQAKVDEFRGRALVPEKPCVRGTAQNPDVWFQAAEAANPYFARVEAIVAAQMEKLAKLTGRKYAPVEYVGDAAAERVVVAMGSACETIEGAIAGEKGVGLIKIRLYRPFPAEAFVRALPKSAKRIAVLDRTKESGSVGEPLYLDAVAALQESGRSAEVIGGRYGLSSKEFTPAMARAVYEELGKSKPKREFVVGVEDDLSGLSLDYSAIAAPPFAGSAALFYGLGSDGTVGANKNSIKIISDEAGKYGQAYFEYDSKKSGGNTISHLRFSDGPIRAPYLVDNADFVAVHHFPLFYSLDILKNAKRGATLLINSPFKEDKLWENLPLEVQRQIVSKELKVHAINAGEVARAAGMGRRINTIMQTAFFHLAGVIPGAQAIAAIKRAIEKTYAKKGREVVEQNFKAVDNAIAGIREVRPGKAAGRPKPAVAAGAPSYEAKMIMGEGNGLKTSELPADGTFPSATSRFEKRAISEFAPKWDPAKCVQCGKCAFACPHAAVRTKAFAGAVAGVASAPMKTKELGERLSYGVGVSPKDCTGCTLCVKACPVGALGMERYSEAEAVAWEKFDKVEPIGREKLNLQMIKHVSLMEPLFEFPGACAGCGEAGYIRLATQLFGDRMVIANATGCSSIYGGNLPTTPYSKDKRGRGPAWSNSLFEDNAEYGYGQAAALGKLRRRAISLLKESNVGDDLKKAIIENPQKTEAEIARQRELVHELKSRAAGALKLVADALVKKSVWIIGGDGWAYDIGYGGLDHVLNMAEDVNILVLDTEVYSNTGGQQSKATPKGASAKFASSGKAAPKKDLGMMAMAAGGAYVAKISMGANEIQALAALREAEGFDGPALVIAYAPCIAHGFDLSDAAAQAKRAVESGHWDLYRYDPRRITAGESPLKLDSAGATLELREYLLKETRYKALAGAEPERFDALVAERERENKYRRRLLEHLAGFKGE